MGLVRSGLQVVNFEKWPIQIRSGQFNFVAGQERAVAADVYCLLIEGTGVRMCIGTISAQVSINLRCYTFRCRRRND